MEPWRSIIWQTVALLTYFAVAFWLIHQHYPYAWPK